MIDIDDMIAAALLAGEEILSVYAGAFSVETKADMTPVTQADLRAERVIVSHLERLAPAIPIIAEEQVARGVVPEIAGRFFLVDPLDGSKEFIARNGEFTVNIALVEGGVPVKGVVLAPALDRLWWADGPEGFVARLVGGRPQDPQPLRCRAPRAEGLTVLASRSHGAPELDAYLETLSVADLCNRGSALKFCLLAEGEADLYPRFGRTMEWDTAAGDAVLRAAGGSVVTLSGAPLAYGKRDMAEESDFANPFFIAAADPRAVPLPARPAGAR